jgi:hypothetical protein
MCFFSKREGNVFLEVLLCFNLKVSPSRPENAQVSLNHMMVYNAGTFNKDKSRRKSKEHK